MHLNAGGWEERIAHVWATATERSEDDVLATVTALAAERPADDATAAFEHASALDSVGREEDAEPLYRRALEAGLGAHQRPRAVIQLASTLRNLGRPEEAIALLDDELTKGRHDGLDDAMAAFLALALLDIGRPDEAVARALTALAPHLHQYGRAVTHYAGELLERDR